MWRSSPSGSYQPPGAVPAATARPARQPASASPSTLPGRRPGDAHALLHAARERIRVDVLESGQADQGDVPLRHLSRRAGGNASDLRSERDILAHRVPGEQRVLLENDAPVGTGPINTHPVNEDLSAIGPDVSGDEVQQCRLPASRIAEEGDEFALRGLERHPAEHEPAVRRGGGIETLVDVFDGELHAGSAMSVGV